MAREKNYISAVIYLGEEKGCAAAFLKMLTGFLAGRFESYELVFVEDASRDGTEGEVRDFLAKMEMPPTVTMVHMSLRQGLEMAMNAGLDAAVGDFVYEFDSMRGGYPAECLGRAYEACVAGADIVSVSPTHNRGVFSSLFYKLFNAGSRSRYQLRTDALRIVSRRAYNRIHAVSAAVPYRKAAYAASGLRLETIEYEGRAARGADHLRTSRGVDALALYTNLGFKAALGIAGVMLALMLGSLVYILVVFLGGMQPVPGWTTTMLLLTGGFFGVFLLLAVVLKYLTLLTGLVFQKQKYLVESVEKIV